MVRSAAAYGTLAIALAASAQPCALAWSTEFGNGELDGLVRCLLVRPAPGGDHIFAGGRFTHAGPGPASRIAEWDGQNWRALGEGVSGIVTGPYTTVYAMAMFDDGTGPALYVGGDFDHAGGAPAGCIARWDGVSWRPLGVGVNNYVRGLKAFDDGSGPALYAAGAFTEAGGAPAVGIARWDGQSWDPLGSGLSAGSIGYSLEVFEAGPEPGLYLGGDFSTVNGITASGIARWDGVAWSSVGGGLRLPLVLTMATLDLGAGPALYLGGFFVVGSASIADYVVRWDGTAWTPFGGLGLGQFITCLGAYNDGSGPRLYAGGPVGPSNMNRWNGASWEAAGTGMTDTPRALVVAQTPSGSVLIAGGQFTGPSSATHPTGFIARWNGGPPWRMGMAERGLVSGVIDTIAIHDDGSGPGAYFGGLFDRVGTTESPALVARTGAGWMAVGFQPGDRVSDIESVVTPAGQTLLAGGVFPGLGVESRRIASRAGSSWTFLPPGGGAPMAFHGGALCAYSWAYPRLVRAEPPWTNFAATDASVLTTMTVLRDGPVPRLFIGGWFSTVGGVHSRHIAAWDGAAWHSFGEGLSNPPGSDQVNAIEVFDDGERGPMVYVTGSLPQFNHIARWDGGAWGPVGAGLSNESGGTPRGTTMAVFDDGGGPALFVAGQFQTAGGSPTGGFARWDGRVWSSGGVDGSVTALKTQDHGDRQSLWVGGNFRFVEGVNSTGIARLDGCRICYPNCDLSTVAPVLNVADFLCFLNRFAAGDPYANCDGSTEPPVLNALDFGCFLGRFGAGCP